ncbi:MAG: FAD-dependent thymidylate synthase [Alphaproteobacteria bacterium]
MTVSNTQATEIAEQKQQSFQTKRPIAPALEEVLYDPQQVLDHGFVRVVDYMGDDNSIVQAARVSYGTGTKKVNEDRGLINYLMRHRHTTPFEMCEIKFHIKLPIFIARQWIRHRTANVNEYSARYSIVEDEFYLPKAENLAQQSQSNRQGRDAALSNEESAEVLNMLKKDAQQCYQNYQKMLNEDIEGNTLDESRPSLARELARMNLTLNYYTEWYWKIDLHNLLHFLSLRADSHAQYEIRCYAETMLDLVKRWVPHTYEAFMNHNRHGTRISKNGVEAVRQMIQGKKVDPKELGISPREWRELMDSLGLEQDQQVA